MSTEPTGPWVEPMIAAGAVDPRRKEPVPSWNRLGEIAHLSTSTVTAMISGSRNTSPTTIRKIAKVLKQDETTISEWLKLLRPVRTQYEPPPEAALLTDRQRKALTNLIRAITAGEQEEGTEHGKRSAKKRPLREVSGEAVSGMRQGVPAPKRP